ncbi:MAG: selenoneine synthase SenA [Alphaproteobacteria bacterium]|nr:selenoneine synthase SenA [Alphaproteobacteria bacterium]
MTRPLPANTLVENLRDARARTIELVQGLSGEQLMGPRLDIVNPLLWEIGHLAWFHEHFILVATDGAEPLLANADELYDSMAVAHDTRWDLPLPSLEDTLDYMARVEDALVARLPRRTASDDDIYLYQLTTFHEDMHDEAFTYTRQTLGYPTPEFAGAADGATTDAEAGALLGDVAVPGGVLELGAWPDAPFVFDNEKWAHKVELEPFRIARAPVTNAAFQAFVADDGYAKPKLWSDDGWAWREAAGAEHPVHWVPGPEGGWSVRLFDRFIEMQPDRPVIHVNWFEANAWCQWAGRRLPSEAEWEAAAASEPTMDGKQLSSKKRRHPWGDAPPEPQHANLDGRNIGCVDVGAFAAGDSAFGCRQMIGNVWEWTSSPFEPYPGFSPDPYKDYSQPWFGVPKVLRGGAWATRGRMISNIYRNFFNPNRRDVFAGFRTCAR